jgi:hypothetical protein
MHSVLAGCNSGAAKAYRIQLVLCMQPAFAALLLLLLLLLPLPLQAANAAPDELAAHDTLWCTPGCCPDLESNTTDKRIMHTGPFTTLWQCK